MSKQVRTIGAVLTAAAFLLMWSFSANFLWAGPPLPDDYSQKEKDKYRDRYDDEILQFSEDYVELIEELEYVLEEFDEFFEEFGQVSIKEYAKAISKLRLQLKENYSSDSHKEMMTALDDMLRRFETLEYELEESNSQLREKRLRNLKALEKDLEDIRKQLNDQFGDAGIHYQLDAETLSKIISRAFEDAQKAMQKARHAYENQRVMVVPPVPAPPAPNLKGIPRSGRLDFSGPAAFDGLLTQSGKVTVDHKDIPIELENVLGGIEVETWNRSEVNIILNIGYKEDSKPSMSLAKEIKLVIDQSPKTVKVSVKYPDRDESSNIVSSRLSVSLPRSNPVKIRNSFGPVTVADLDNTLKIQSSFSAIDVQHIRGNVVIANSSGAVYAEDIKGFLEITNAFAPIEVVYITGGARLANGYAPIMVEKSSGKLDINSSGEVSVNRHDGHASIRSSNGRIEIFGVTGNLLAVNSFGAMQIENIGGNAEIENASGPIEITDVAGFLKVSNNFAAIEISGIGKEVTVRSSNGNIALNNTKDSVNISNRFGEVSVESAAGPVSIVNASGAVTVSRVFAPVTVVNQFSPVVVIAVSGNVDIENANASVNLSDIKGATKVKTSFGLVSGENLKGPFLIGNENGSVELVRVADITADSEIKTTFGDILLDIPKAGSYNFTATTTYGKIESDLPLKISSSGDIHTGKYVAGKSNPTITLTGSNSSIKIRTE